uniref:Uncharacterized protein n=1 Tax=Setaria digitata TaxID=48799 RepID=A0A915PMC4_9BILA
MGGSQSQSYDLSQESAKSAQEKQDIVPSNHNVDGTLIHITTSENSNTLLPNTQELQRIHPPEDIPLTSVDVPPGEVLLTAEDMPLTKTAAPKISETTAE